MSVKNSLSTLLSQMVSLTNNNLSMYKSVSDAVLSNKKSVKLQIENDLSRETVDVPTFKNMSTNIDRLDSTMNTAMNLNGTESTVRLSDGSWRRLMLAKVPTEGVDVSEDMMTVNLARFYSKKNYFYDNLLNPLLYISINLTLPGYDFVSRVFVRKIVLDYSSEYSYLLESNNFTTTQKISYSDLVEYLDKSGMAYSVDDELVDVTPKECRYSGTFNVIKVANNESTAVVINSEKITTNNIIYLDTIKYDDTLNDAEGSMLLNTGDYLYLYNDDNDITTRIKVTGIDTATNMITADYVEGLEYITTGSVLKLDQATMTKSNSFDVDCTVTPNKIMYVFVKLVDNDTNLLSKNWSVGKYIGNTNDLVIKINNEDTKLLQYYAENVNDFGKVALANSTDYYPTVLDINIDKLDGIVPIIDADKLKVVKMNGHLNDNTEKIKQLSNQKIERSNEIQNARNLISKLKTKLNTFAYASQTDKDNDEKELDTTSESLSRLSEEFKSLVNQITSLSNSILDTEEYHVQGFIGGVNAFTSESSICASGKTINVIGYEYQYRYISNNGVLPTVNEYEIPTVGSDNTVTGKATKKMNTWNLVRNPYKNRVKVSSNGVTTFKWDNVSEQSDFNKIDVPILRNSQLAIRARYVLDAGYPSNPIKSNWSEESVVPFNTVNDSIDIITDNNNIDEVKNTINDELVSNGLKVHNNDSFNANNKYFAHHADNIASGFYDENTYTQITLYDKLKTISDTLNNFINNGDYVASDKTITVSLINKSTKKETILKEGTNKIILPKYEQLDYIDVDKSITDTNKPAVEQNYTLRISSMSRSILYNMYGGNRNNALNTDKVGSSGIYYVNDMSGNTVKFPISVYTDDTTDTAIGKNLTQNNLGQLLYMRSTDISQSVDLVNGLTEDVAAVYKLNYNGMEYHPSMINTDKSEAFSELSAYVYAEISLADKENIQFENNKINSQYDVTNDNNTFKDYDLNIYYRVTKKCSDAYSQARFTVIPIDLFVKSFSNIIKMEYDIVFINENPL